MNRLTNQISLALFATVTLTIAQGATAGGTTGQSPVDVFDMSNGTTIISSDDDAPERAFDTTNQVFFPNNSAGYTSHIEWETGDYVLLSGVRVFGNHDDVGLEYRRSMRRFVLKADLDDNGSVETTLIDLAIDPTYQSVPNNIATDNRAIDLTIDLAAPVRAKRWRLEVEQGVSFGEFDGVRLREVDGIGIFDPDPTCDGDADGNGVVDANDLAYVIFRLGACP